MSAMTVATNTMHRLTSATYQVFRCPRTLALKILGCFGLRSVSCETTRSINLKSSELIIPGETKPTPPNLVSSERERHSSSNLSHNPLGQFSGNQISDSDSEYTDDLSRDIVAEGTEDINTNSTDSFLIKDCRRSLTDFKNELAAGREKIGQNTFNISIIKPGEIWCEEDAVTYLKGLLNAMKPGYTSRHTAFNRKNPLDKSNKDSEFIRQTLRGFDFVIEDLEKTDDIINNAYSEYINFNTAVYKIERLIRNFEARLISRVVFQNLFESCLKNAQTARDGYKTITEGSAFIEAVTLREKMRECFTEIKRIDESLKLLA